MFNLIILRTIITPYYKIEFKSVTFEINVMRL